MKSGHAQKACSTRRLWLGSGVICCFCMDVSMGMGELGLRVMTREIQPCRPRGDTDAVHYTLHSLVIDATHTHNSIQFSSQNHHLSKASGSLFHDLRNRVKITHLTSISFDCILQNRQRKQRLNISNTNKSLEKGALYYIAVHSYLKILLCTGFLSEFASIIIQDLCL